MVVMEHNLAVLVKRANGAAAWERVAVQHTSGNVYEALADYRRDRPEVVGYDMGNYWYRFLN